MNRGYRKCKGIIAAVLISSFLVGNTATAYGAQEQYSVPMSDENQYAALERTLTGVDTQMQETLSTACVTASYLNVRTGPGTNYKIITALQKDTVVTVIGKFENGWYKLLCNNVSGYVSGDYLSFIDDNISEGTDSGLHSLSAHALTTDYLNVRTGPNSSYKKIGLLQPNTKVQITGVFPTVNWYKIRYSNSFGYVCGDYLTGIQNSAPPSTTESSTQETTESTTETPSEDLPPEQEAPKALYGVTTASVNIREGAGTSYKVKGVLSAGTEFTITGKSESGNWYQLSYNNTVCYISKKYVKLIDKLTQENPILTDEQMEVYAATGKTTGSLNLRKGPDTRCDKISVLPNGAKVTVVGKFENGWFKIKYNDTYAYVCGDYVSIESEGVSDEPEASIPDSGITECNKNATVLANLNIRKGPGTSYSKLGVLSAGTVITIIGEADSGWLKIQYDSGTGYVYGQYVKVLDGSTAPSNPIDDILYIPSRNPLSSAYVPSGLVDINKTYGLSVENGPKMLVGEAAKAYYEMYKAAQAAGVLKSGDMSVRSAYRSYTAQKIEYSNAVNKAQAALPGESEHQLGVAVDIKQINYSTFKYSPLYKWLKDNSYKYGFILRYTADKTSVTGIIDEPWHYRYVGKANAEKIYRSGKCLEEYVDSIK